MQDQKDAMEKGLVSMEDVEMAAAEGTSKEPSHAHFTHYFHWNLLFVVLGLCSYTFIMAIVAC